MRKNVFGRQLKRDKNERAALFKGLITSLVIFERIKTTEDKAKAIKADVDKIITIAKKGEAKARNLLQSKLSKNEIEKVIFEIAPRFKGRQGGYTRIIRIGRRFFDNAQMVFLEWTEREKYEKPATTETQKKHETQKLIASGKFSDSVVAREISKSKGANTRKRKKEIKSKK